MGSSVRRRRRVGGIILGAAAAAAHETLKTLASDAGATALYDPDSPDTWTLRDDGSDLWYSAIADGLGNREDWGTETASEQPKQITLSTGRRAMLAEAGSVSFVATFASVITQPNTLLIVGRNTGAAGRERWIDANSFGISNRQMIGADQTSTNGWMIWADNFVSPASPAVDANWTILHGNYNGASGEMFRNGTSIVTGDAGDANLGGLEIRNINSNDIEIGPVLVFTGLKTNAELSDIRDHINENWPIGLAA